MTGKLSYYHFLADFIPGAFLTGVALIAFRDSLPVEILPNLNAAVDTLLFGVWALVLGHALSYRASRGLQERIKKKVWGGFASERFLTPGSKLCSESRRKRYLELVKEKHVITADGFAALETCDLSDTEALKKAANASHSVYQAFHTAIRDGGKGEKAEIANTEFGLYRGLSVASFYGMVLLMVAAVIRFLLSPSLEMTGYLFPVSNVLPDIILALFLLYLYHAFKQRVIERGQAHVREVFDSFWALNAEGEGKGATK